jgi:hypothetical protein
MIDVEAKKPVLPATLAEFVTEQNVGFVLPESIDNLNEGRIKEVFGEKYAHTVISIPTRWY